MNCSNHRLCYKNVFSSFFPIDRPKKTKLFLRNRNSRDPLIITTTTIQRIKSPKEDKRPLLTAHIAQSNGHFPPPHILMQWNDPKDFFLYSLVFMLPIHKNCILRMRSRTPRIRRIYTKVKYIRILFFVCVWQWQQHNSVNQASSLWFNRPFQSIVHSILLFCVVLSVCVCVSNAAVPHLFSYRAHGISSAMVRPNIYGIYDCSNLLHLATWPHVEKIMPGSAIGITSRVIFLPQKKKNAKRN